MPFLPLASQVKPKIQTLPGIWIRGLLIIRPTLLIIYLILKPSEGNLRINTTNSAVYPLLREISHPLPLNHVFLSPRLSENLLSIGQLVDNHCFVSFSRSGCVIQYQVSGKLIAKGPKCGRLFPLQLSTKDRNLVASALFSASSSNESQLWHNRLGHPHSHTLLSLFKFGLLHDNKISHKDVSFNCSSCKMSKARLFLFPSVLLYH